MDEEKINLVLMDICGRLPHGVITKNCKNNFDVPAHMLPHVNGIKLLIAEYDLNPYLRPMSSMTEEEIEEYWTKINNDAPEMPIDEIPSIENIAKCSEVILDFLNSHYLDYRGLIPIGLALEAPEDMYKTE